MSELEKFIKDMASRSPRSTKHLDRCISEKRFLDVYEVISEAKRDGCTKGALALLEYAKSMQREEILISGLRLDGVVEIKDLEAWCHGKKE